MREICTSGSEGGEPQRCGLPYPIKVRSRPRPLIRDGQDISLRFQWPSGKLSIDSFCVEQILLDTCNSQRDNLVIHRSVLER